MKQCEPHLESPRRNRKTLFLMTSLLVFCGVLALLCNLEADYHISPRYTVRITDDAMAPVAGVRVEHPWASGALGLRGTQRAGTDSNGVVVFDLVKMRVSLLRHLLTKEEPPAHAAGYVGWLDYGSSDGCTVYLPEGFAVVLDDKAWNPTARGLGIRPVTTNTEPFSMTVITENRGTQMSRDPGSPPWAARVLERRLNFGFPASGQMTVKLTRLGSKWQQSHDSLSSTGMRGTGRGSGGFTPPPDPVY